MKQRNTTLGLILSCSLLVLAIIACASAPDRISGTAVVATTVITQQLVPTLTAPPSTPAAEAATTAPPGATLNQTTPELSALYDQASPGVVNIRVFVSQNGQSGQAAGSGFVLDSDGHIVTNNHVVADAQLVIVVFHDGSEVEASIVGTDADSDLAVVKVDALPQGIHALALGDSDQVRTGEWVAAIGNPFGLGTSLSVGVVSATGRTIESGATPFSIPEAIQTDAAINPGNSGGPLLNLRGEVIGVNAQIATGGQTQANSGVGFAIPANVVRRVAPVLIKAGHYQWPWLGIRGDSVNLFIAQANKLQTQRGAYLHEIEPGGPAEQAGLRGSQGSASVNGLDVPTGGDVVVEADGQPVGNFSDLLAITSQHAPGDTLALTIVRDGQQQQVQVTLAPRPSNSGP